MLYMQPVQDLTVERQGEPNAISVLDGRRRAQEFRDWAPRLVEKLKQAPALRDVASDQQNSGLQANLVIDRDTASRLGITPQAIDDTLYDAFGQRQVSTMFTQLNQYHVVLEAEPGFQDHPEDLEAYLRKSSSPPAVGAAGTTAAAPSQVPCLHLPLRAAKRAAGHQSPGTVSGGDDCRSISRPECLWARQRRRSSRRSSEIDLPAQHSSRVSRERRPHFKIRLSSEPWLILAAIITVYIVLGVLYESYIHPITILSTLPSAGVGAILALLITGNDLSVVALIGIILLIGIVKKNAIMMIDFALEAEREEGKAPEEAIYQACLLRFRPIMMTTMAALLGGLPLALGRGTGSELRHPLGITIVGGLMVSQLLTLYTTPVVYLWFDRLAQRFSQVKIGNRIEEPVSEVHAD